MQTNVPLQIHGRLIGVVAILLIATLAPCAAAEGRTGEQIWRMQCASCHGANGEGTKEHHPQPLTGDKTIAALARTIAKTMPEDDPGSLSAADADKVAAYVYESFYSREARERTQPPRLELARLTVRQYRNAVADLVGSFRASVPGGDKQGLHGEYFKSRRFQNEQRVFERLDPEVRFDFGTDSPDKDKLDPYGFSIRWEGSILAPETGVYEFVIRTEHAGRLWVNDPNRPLVDAWVKSGDDTEFKASIFLLGGRAYPLRLDFSKATQGVNNKKKDPNAKPPAKASVALLWKVPQRTTEVIPVRNLSPAHTAESFVVTTPFPPDDRSFGWERGTTISKAWDQSTTDAAIETAGYVAAHLDELAGIRMGVRERPPNSGNPADINLDTPAGAKPAADRPEKVRQFAYRFVGRAFRQPLSAEQKRLFVDRQFEAAKDLETAVKRVVLVALKSPRFLYREVGSGPEGFDVASRLAFALWDSVPDAELLTAAAAGRLATRDEVMHQAERMLADPRARAKVREFFLTWLKVDQAPDLAKDPKRFAGFDATIASDLRASLERFLEDVVWGEGSDFRRLFLDDTVFLNGRLAKFYGVELPEDAGFQKVKWDAQERAGVLTHPYLMASFAYTGSTSPIHRGVFLARGVLGLSLRPPPEAFTPLAEDLHPKLTTRERVALQTRPANCQGCHGVINPLGYTLEHFDAIGRYRDKDNDKPIDATGGYVTRTGRAVVFTRARDLANYLAASEEAHEAFIEQLFHHLVKQPVRAYGASTLAGLRQSFARNGFNIRKLVTEVATLAALPPKPPPKD